MLRHKQEAILQKSEINGALDKTIPYILEVLEKWRQRGTGWVVDRVETLWLDIAWYQPLRGSLYSSTHSREEQESHHQCQEQGLPLPPLVTTISPVPCGKNVDTPSQ